MRPGIQHIRRVRRAAAHVSLLIFDTDLALREIQEWDGHLFRMHITGLLHEAGVVAQAAIERGERIDTAIASGGEYIGESTPAVPHHADICRCRRLQAYGHK
jgi:hypothetical protein